MSPHRALRPAAKLGVHVDFGLQQAALLHTLTIRPAHLRLRCSHAGPASHEDRILMFWSSASAGSVDYSSSYQAFAHVLHCQLVEHLWDGASEHGKHVLLTRLAAVVEDWIPCHRVADRLDNFHRLQECVEALEACWVVGAPCGPHSWLATAPTAGRGEDASRASAKAVVSDFLRAFHGKKEAEVMQGEEAK